MRMRCRPALCIGFVVPFAMMQGGCTNVLAFGTATKFGLDIAQRADQTVDVTMGYDRTEIASIPVPQKDKGLDADDTSDTYAVLGTFKVKYDSPLGEKNEPLEIDQFFATGLAARKAAKSPEFGIFFGKNAGCIAKKIAESANRSANNPPGSTDCPANVTSGAE